MPHAVNDASGLSAVLLQNPLSPDYGLRTTGSITPKARRGGGIWVPLAFCINFIFGAGVLGIPYAVAHAGVLASVVTMLFFAFLSALSMVWLTEACARAEAMQSAIEDKWNDPKTQAGTTEETPQFVLAGSLHSVLVQSCALRLELLVCAVFGKAAWQCFNIPARGLP